MIKTRESINVQEVEGLRGGNGTAEIHHIIEGDELKEKGKLFSKIILPKGASIGLHEHSEDFEVYYILKGKGLVREGEEAIEVREGDAVYTSDGQKHSIENVGEEDLEFMAVVIYE